MQQRLYEQQRLGVVPPIYSASAQANVESVNVCALPRMRNASLADIDFTGSGKIAMLLAGDPSFSMDHDSEKRRSVPLNDGLWTSAICTTMPYPRYRQRDWVPVAASFVRRCKGTTPQRPFEKVRAR
ncbi:hypothetical protein [Paraburkholderia sp. MM6662-R1]|uniref:hypothetical protein n=1 Tax=Paraburkholderia sp. MM6662-R1 TaxID=2991066 RepID=UPI003D1CBC43